MKNRILQVLPLLFLGGFIVASTLLTNNETVSSQNEVESELPKDLPTINGSAGAIVVPDVIPDVHEPEPESQKYVGYLTTNVNVRTEPNTNSSVLEVFKFNREVEYVVFNEEWVQIEYGDDFAYLNKTYISSAKNTYRTYNVPKTSGFKSFEPYNCFNPKYKQYALQECAYTDSNGLRVVNGRYCIALGTYFFENLTNSTIGTYVDLILENGEIIPCVLGDVKADEHTDANNIVTIASGCLSEFICDKSKLPKLVKQMGDISYAKPEWNSPVEKIVVYEKNFFD